MLDISKMDPFVLNVLREHGWYEERQYDISEWLNVLSGEGFVSFEYAENILKSLGGIYVNFAGGPEHKSPQFSFDPFIINRFYDELSSYEAVVDDNLYPIGEMLQGIAYVGKSKKIYWGDWRELYLMGESIEDYLNNLFDRKAKPKLIWTNPRPDEDD